MSGVVPSLLAMPLKLIGRGVLGAVVGWLMVAGRWLVGLGVWTRLACCAARAAAVSSVAARVDARIRVTFMGLPPSLGSSRRGAPATEFITKNRPGAARSQSVSLRNRAAGEERWCGGRWWSRCRCLG